MHFIKFKLTFLSIAFFICSSFLFSQHVLQPEALHEPAPRTSANSSKISLKLKNMDIIEVFNILSQKGKLNIIAGTNVRGRVTLFLENVEVLDAFKLVAETNSLAYIHKGNVIQVLTDREYELLYGKRFYDKTQVRIFRLKHASNIPLKPVIEGLKSRVGKIFLDSTSNSIIVMDTQKSIKAIQEAIEKLDVPLQTKVYTLHYTHPKEIESKLTPLLSKRGILQSDQNANKIIVTDIPVSFEIINTIISEYDVAPKLATRIFSLKYADYEKIQEQVQIQITKDVGFIEVDKRTDKIAITDYPEAIDRISYVIHAFDEKHREVLIEAKIIQVNLDNTFKYGVNWEFIATAIANNNFSLAASSAFKLLSETPVTDSTPFPPFEQRLTQRIPPFDNRAGTFPGGRMILAGLADGGIDGQGNPYQAVIDALRTQGDVNILSTPRIAVINHEEAEIQVGTNEAYVTTSVVQNTSNATTAENVNFIQVGVLLKVTPHINEDGYITMEIEPEVSSVASFLKTASGNQIPIVRTSNAKTRVMVKDGVTIVIGGLIDRNIRKVRSKVPILGSIPIIGLAFRSIDNKIQNRELIIFLTPHIITGDVNTLEEAKYAERFKEMPKKNTGIKDDIKELLEN